MSRNDSDSDDLTTDAVPSPPRDEVKKEKHEEEEEINTGTRPKVANAHRIPKSKTYSKTKKTGPTAFANVINISNANGVHVGSNYNVYVNNSKPESTQKQEFVVTDAIKSFFKSTEPVTSKHLQFISPHLNEHWRMTARSLNYSDGQISQFYENHSRTGIKEVIYQLLLDWIQNESDSATVGKLSSTLWETNQQDVVTRWVKNFKCSSQ